MGTFYGEQKFKTAMTQDDINALKAIDSSSTTPWKDDAGARWKQYYSAASGREAVMAVFHRNFVDSKTFSMKLGDTLKFQAGFFIGDTPLGTSYENASGVLSLILMDGLVSQADGTTTSTVVDGKTVVTTIDGNKTTTVIDGKTTTTIDGVTSSAFALSASLTFAATAAMILM